MEALTNEKQNVRLVRIDIDTWESDVAQQHRIRSLPTLWLYDGTERVSSDVRAVFGRVHQLD